MRFFDSSAAPLRPALQASALLLSLFLFPGIAAAQGILEGRVVDRVTRAPLASALLEVETAAGARSVLAGSDGTFRLPGLEPGVYAVRATLLGYAPALVTDLVVQSSRPTFVLVEMRPTALELEGITVAADPFQVPSTAPVSATLLSPEEVRRTPGGLQDISRSLLSLPGVIGGVDNRNDLLVRGGGPGENAYYLDGIRIPQINHFATQGATGGALGLVNVDFIRETEFFTGGFPARYGDALSSVLSIRNRPGTRDGVRGDVTLGASEAGLTLDGPLGGDGNWLFSVRRSYLQFLFEALGLPIRPDYWDAQGRLEWFPTDRDRVVWTGIGALDEFDLVAPDAGDIENQEIFDRVLDNDQKSYTVGGLWERQVGQGVVRLVASRSWTDYRFRDVDGADVEVLRNRSTEVRMPLRLEGETRLDAATEIEWGVMAERVGVDLDLFQEATPGSPFDEPITTEAALRSWRTGAYLQTVRRFADERLRLTAGARVDHDAALDEGASVSPRLGASLALGSEVTLSAAAGWFHQSPALLSVAVEEDGIPVNRDLLPIRNVQGVLGVAWRPQEALRIQVEGFWKEYSRYPVLRDDPRISLANLGGDYGFVGAEPLEPIGDGRARGVELFVQRKLTDAVWLLGAYTLSSSEFAGSDGKLAPSSWDVRHAVDLTAGWRPGSRWELGTKLRVLSGRPFTPFDEARSAAEYARTGRGVPDWDRIGAERTGAYARLDLRAERVFDFGGWNGRLFLDVQNVLARPNEIGFTYTQDPAFPDGRRPIDGTGLLPFFGFSVEF
ncbi:MAG: TonB-dependent receptor [Gemmatimonadetes bacterium]|nr:TonB-dependent receptor [Gemmatimonadota bacterium]